MKTRRLTQRGFALIVAMIVIIMLAGMSMAFIGRAGSSSRVSDSLGDANLAQLLAEAASSLATYCTGTNPCTWKPASAPAAPLDPFFYIVAAGSAPTPTIVERVAAGEAQNASAAALGPQPQQVAASVTRLRIQDLFAAPTKPYLYVQNPANGAMSAVTGSSWNAQLDAPGTAQQAAVWFELEDAGGGAFTVYCAAAAQYGHAKSYVRQNCGTM